jgi:hypothetical protein
MLKDSKVQNPNSTCDATENSMVLTCFNGLFAHHALGSKWHQPGRWAPTAGTLN